MVSHPHFIKGNNPQNINLTGEVKKTNLQGTSLLISNELFELSNIDRYQKLSGAKRFFAVFTTACSFSVSQEIP